MMLACLLFCIMHQENRLAIEVNHDNTIFARVEFPEASFDRTALTRFIIADTPPLVTYTLSDSESLPIDISEGPIATSPVTIGREFFLDNQAIYPIVIHPYYMNNYAKISYESIDIMVDFDKPSTKLQLPGSLVQVYHPLTLNNQWIERIEPQGYLIITPDAFYDEILPLAQWKEKKGWHVVIARLSQIGGSAIEIKNYIANAYFNDSIPPEYVLLIGDRDSLPPYSTTLPVSTSDYPYSLIEGDDFLAEVMVGRLPANTENEVTTIVTKTIGYEQTPYLTDPAWFKRALVVAANYPINIMTTPIPTKRWVRDRLYEAGFATVDTVYYPPTTSGVPITNSINQGVVFVNYRGGDADPDGWIHPNFHNTEVTGLSNGWKLPIVTSIVCLNGNFSAPTCFGEAWVRAGNPVTPRGAVAFFGASAANTSSRWNNCLDFGVYWGILKEEIYSIGPATYRGKMEVYLNFPLDTTWAQGASYYFHTYNLLGDPSLDIWTDTPDTFNISHTTSFPVGTNSFTVTVLNSSNQPVEDALVSLYKSGEVKETGYTDAAGNVQLTFATNSPDTLFVTVTKHNFKPYCGYALVANSAVYVGHESHVISDPTGNNNGEINPGETIDMPVTLKNFGNATTATNISATLRSNDPHISITDSIKNYSNLAPGGTATGAPYRFTVTTNTPHEHKLKFSLAITATQGSWTSHLWIPTQAPVLAFLRKSILDGGNGELEPGETSDLSVTIENIGGLAGTNITGILRSWHDGVSVIDSTGTFGNIAIGDSAVNSGDRFQIQAASSIAEGHEVGFTVFFSGDQNFGDTVNFKITIGIVATNTPLGPDDYGYYAYDDTDTGFSEHPTYNWIEIDPELSGPGDTISLQNDETKVLALPFSFKYYGNWYDRISVCSNGYLAMDSTWIADMYNWHIGAAGAPSLLIAPFWDDFDPTASDSSGHVCYWFDVSNHRFVIEHSRIQHIHDPTNPTPAELQSFETILYDPQYYPTLTNDGEIIFQYRVVQNDDQWHNYATVGIQNQDHTMGLEYTYADIYPAAAVVLANNRAIKFTSDPPDTFPGVEETEDFTILSPTLRVLPNPFRNHAYIEYRSGGNTKSTVIHIYDITGRLVKRISLSNPCSLLPATVVWDGSDEAGNELPEGVYFIHVADRRGSLIQKIVMLR